MCKKFADALELIDLSPFRKIIIIDRFLHVLERLHSRSNWYRWLNSVGSTFVSIGSLLTPALLSIKSDDNEDEIFYLTWSTALATALSSSLMQLFQITKKYILFTKTLEKLQSEGFMFFELAGGYRTDDPNGHAAMFTTFCTNVENIHGEEVTSEFQNKSSSDTKEQDHKLQSLLGRVQAHSAAVEAQLNALESSDDEEKGAAK